MPREIERTITNWLVILHALCCTVVLIIIGVPGCFQTYHQVEKTPTEIRQTEQEQTKSWQQMDESLGLKK